jgi:hypothetical protein
MTRQNALTIAEHLAVTIEGKWPSSQDQAIGITGLDR